MISDVKHSEASEVEDVGAEQEASPLKTILPGILTAGLFFIITLAVSFYLAPALVTFLELTAGLFATVEIVARTHFFLITVQWVLVILFFLHAKPVAGLRQRLLLYFLLAEGAVRCGIWLLDKPEVYFRSEASSVTPFSSLVLALCAAGAFINLFILRAKEGTGRLRIFWSLLSVAFLFAAVDEFFRIHERLAALTGANHFVQDLLPVT